MRQFDLFLVILSVSREYSVNDISRLVLRNFPDGRKWRATHGPSRIYIHISLSFFLNYYTFLAIHLAKLSTYLGDDKIYYSYIMFFLYNFSAIYYNLSPHICVLRVWPVRVRVYIYIYLEVSTPLLLRVWM